MPTRAPGRPPRAPRAGKGAHQREGADAPLEQLRFDFGERLEARRLVGERRRFVDDVYEADGRLRCIPGQHLLGRLAKRLEDGFGAGRALERGDLLGADNSRVRPRRVVRART
jgi:hypothetical protein